MKSDLLPWQFVNDEGTFRLENPHHTSYLYFPLVNEAGMMSAITPTLNGDIKIHQNAYLTLPVSMEDLNNASSARNFWVHVVNAEPWSVIGISALQKSQRFKETDPEDVTLEAGFLWHKITRQNLKLGLRAEVTNFVPASEDKAELMMVRITNISNHNVSFTPTSAIPIFGRSADLLRDHRHVTSLLHRIQCATYGVLVQPMLTFDERGHRPNQLTYCVLGTGGNGKKPIGFFPVVEDFIGEGGTLDWPKAIVESQPPIYLAGHTHDGYEAIGGICFDNVTLQPGESSTFVLILAILDEIESTQILIDRYGTEDAFTKWLERTKNEWRSRLDTFKVTTGDSRFDLWMRWVSIQPILRRWYGNSLLPAHDYGRGGRGWRDLWQDILALLLMEKGDVSKLLYSNFAGVRIDGSNATIIGSTPGEFKADRNNIPRVWMDHGAWPLLTTKLYIDQTGDLAFLLREQTYFKDHLIFRSQIIDDDWQPEQGTLLRTSAKAPYMGTILEHILIQHLIPFFNVGAHNMIRLEGADWNDGLDMARERGESVAFSALYAGNIRQLSVWVLALAELNIDRVELAAEILTLLDTLTNPLDYDMIEAKHDRLQSYFESCSHILSGEKIAVSLEDLAEDLRVKADWLSDHIRKNEWISNTEGFSWFNGYYDNDGKRVEGDHPNGVRMTLTGQVFTLLGGVATEQQALEIVRAADQYLYEASMGGYRLNTNFGEVMLNLGRAFGFAFGHKENGAMFSHMAIMYANALYQRGLVREGYKVIAGIYRHCQDFTKSLIYPGIPEYINPRGRGMYTWLTGSASWLVFTLIAEVFGVRGSRGNLMLNPKLISEQFDESGKATLTTMFAGKLLEVTYDNPKKLDYGQYYISSITVNDQPVDYSIQHGKCTIDRKFIIDHPASKLKISVELSSDM